MSDCFWVTKDSEGNTCVGFCGIEINKAYFTILKTIKLSGTKVDAGLIIAATLERLGFTNKTEEL